MNSTLILNADTTPLSLVPISSISWQDAAIFTWTKKADALHFYDNWTIHSAKISYQVPSVMILRNYIHIDRNDYLGGDNPAARLIFLRDGYECQYCHKKFSYSQLTLDHVIPKKYGGKTSWDNCCASCSPCNGKKGHNTKIKPKNKPFKPSYYYLSKMIKKINIIIPHESWNFYLGWDEDKIKIINPNSDEYKKINFDLYDPNNIKLIQDINSGDNIKCQKM